jgi:hypothetical protein
MKKQRSFKISESEIIGRGLKCTEFIKKGDIFFKEVPFAVLDNFITTWDPRIVKFALKDSPVGVTMEEAFLMSCLSKFEKNPEILKNFVNNHNCISFQLTSIAFENILNIAKIFNIDINFVSNLFSTIKDNAFSLSFPLQFALIDLCIYDVASFANHRCVNANTSWIIDGESRKIKFIANQDIKKGDWITISYQVGIDNLPVDERQRILKDKCRFVCKCEDCLKKLCGIPKVCGLEIKKQYKISEYDTNNISLFIKLHKHDIQSDIVFVFLFLDTLRDKFIDDMNKTMKRGNGAKLCWKSISEDDIKILESTRTRFPKNINLLNSHDVSMLLMLNLSIILLAPTVGSSTLNSFIDIKINIMDKRKNLYGVDEMDWLSKIFPNVDCPFTKSIMKELKK